jgi:hypothetical protein
MKTGPQQPSYRQKKAMKIFLDNGGKSVSRALREAGYSKQTAKNPKKITETKGWQQLMEEYLGDELLATTHHALLKDENPMIRNAALAQAYKVKGKYAPDTMKVSHSYEDLLADNE